MSLKMFFLALGFMLSPSVWADQYQVKVNATITNDLNYPVIFGSTTAIPVQYTFTIDTSLAAISTITAGTFINSFGGSFTQDIQLIPKATITNLHITAGTTGAWTQADLTNQQFDNLQNYNVAIIGNLAAGNVGIVMAVSNPTSGDLAIGGVQCPASACSFNPVGFATSNADGALSDVAGVSAVITNVGSTAATDLSALIATVATSSNINKPTLKIFTDAIVAAQKLQAANKPKDAKIALLAFAVLVDAAKSPIFKTGETAAQATSFISAAKIISNEL